MNFHVGQKVVCIDAGQTNRIGFQELEKGRVYTVRWVGVDENMNPLRPELNVTLIRIRLVEVARLSAPDMDVPFSSYRFRPVIERKTDISIFTEMLRDVRSREPASIND